MLVSEQLMHTQPNLELKKFFFALHFLLLTTAGFERKLELKLYSITLYLHFPEIIWTCYQFHICRQRIPVAPSGLKHVIEALTLPPNFTLFQSSKAREVGVLLSKG